MNITNNNDVPQDLRTIIYELGKIKTALEGCLRRLDVIEHRMDELTKHVWLTRGQLALMMLVAAGSGGGAAVLLRWLL